MSKLFIIWEGGIEERINYLEASEIPEVLGCLHC